MNRIHPHHFLLILFAFASLASCSSSVPPTTQAPPTWVTNESWIGTRDFFGNPCGYLLTRPVKAGEPFAMNDVYKTQVWSTEQSVQPDGTLSPPRKVDPEIDLRGAADLVGLRFTANYAAGANLTRSMFVAPPATSQPTTNK